MLGTGHSIGGSPAALHTRLTVRSQGYLVLIRHLFADCCDCSLFLVVVLYYYSNSMYISSYTFM
jgi:hypothetical protein